MSQSELTKDELVESLYQYIKDQELSDPWAFRKDGETIVPYDDWPVRLPDVIDMDEIDFDPETRSCTINVEEEEEVSGYMLRRRGAAGGDYIDFRQVLYIQGTLVFKDSTEAYRVDEEKTDLDYEIVFDVSNYESYK
jgi:hypothetical protein